MVPVAAAALMAAVTAAPGDVNRETAVVEVGASTITAADILVHADRLVLREPAGDSLADRRRLIEPIVDGRLMVLEARARGLDDDTHRRQFERLERDRLVAELERVEIRERIVLDEPAIEEGTRRSGLVLHLHHIQTESEASAESLLARIAAGEPFAELARAHSTAGGSAAGALPPVTWGQLPPELEEVAYHLAPGEIGGPIEAQGSWHLVRLDSLTATGADPDSLREGVIHALERARFNEGQIRLLAAMKEELHYAADDSVIALFLLRMNEWQDAGAPDSASTPGRDRFGFSASERALPIFTYDYPLDSPSGDRGHGEFTIGAYSDYMADQPAARVRTRTEGERVERDLDQYFRHHAYSELARARGYLVLYGIEPEVRRLRERALIGRLSFIEVNEKSPPTDEELREYHAAHRERYRAAADTTEVLPFDAVRERVESDLVAEREAARFDSLMSQLRERYPIVYHDEALLRLPLRVR